MCNEYAQLKAIEKLAEEFSRLRLPAFEWLNNQIPNDLNGKDSIRVRDTAMAVRLRDEKLQGAMMTWAWSGPHKKPVFNYVSEGRDFTNSDRVLVPATGFYEYTTPSAPKVKLKLDLLFYRVDNTVEAIRAGTAKPIRDRKRMERLLCDRLEKIDPGFGIEIMTLSAISAEPLEYRQSDSWHERR